MKLSNTTLNILKNYSSINESIIFRQGNKLNTCANAKNLLGFATIEEEIPCDAPIYNLQQFISTINLLNDPDLDFQEDFVVISDDSSDIKYHYAAEELIDIPSKVPAYPDEVVKFIFTQDALSSLIKASGVLNLEDLVLRNKGGSLTLSITDNNANSASSNEFNIPLNDVDVDGNCSFNFKTSTLKLIPDDYTCTIFSKTVKGKNRFIAVFESTSCDNKYYIALEPSSFKD